MSASGGSEDDGMLWPRLGLGLGALLVFVVSLIVVLPASAEAFIALVALAAGMFVLAWVLPWFEDFKIGPLSFKSPRQETLDATSDATAIDVPKDEVEKRIASEDDGPPTASKDDPFVVGTLRAVAGDLAMRAIFDDLLDQPGLEECDARLFLFDDADQCLKSSFDSSGDDPSVGPTFVSGQGATGAAWERREYVLAAGQAVWDDTFRLTDAQQAMARELTCVAATPVWNDQSEVIAILTISTRSANLDLSADEFQREHLLAALLVSRVLIDLFGWFNEGGVADDADEVPVTGVA